MTDKPLMEICPVCGSSDVYLETGGYTGKRYHCKNCGYIGALIIEADEEMAEAIREDYEQGKKTNETQR
jgi:uncharacterized Zn finger protein